MARNLKGIIFVNRSHLLFYQERSTNVLTLPLKSSIEDLGNIDKLSLVSYLQTWIETNKIHPSQIIVIASQDVLFEKEFEEENEDTETKINQFLDKIPVDELISRGFKGDKKITIVATAKEFYDSIIEILENNGFEVKNFIPEFLLTPIFKTTELNQTTGPLYIKKFNHLKSNSLSLNPKGVNYSRYHFVRKESNVTQKYLPILLLFFVILSGVLFVILIFQKNLQNQAPKSLTYTKSPKIAQKNTPIASSEASMVSPLKIRLTYYKTATSEAKIMQEKLEKGMFKKITPDPTLIKSIFPSVTFSKKVAVDIRDPLLKIIKTVKPEITIKETDDFLFDVTIIL